MFLLTASLNNVHEDIRNKPSSWTVVAFLPSLDKDVSHHWDTRGGNGLSVRNTEIMMHSWDALFQGWNAASEFPKPHEWADGQMVMTHLLYFGNVVDKQEEDKLLADPDNCHTCWCTPEHYLDTEMTFPPKTSKEVLAKILDAASTSVRGQLLMGSDEHGHRHWKGTQDAYTDLRKQAGGAHLLYNPFHEIVHTDCQQQVPWNTCDHMYVSCMSCTLKQEQDVHVEYTHSTYRFIL